MKLTSSSWPKTRPSIATSMDRCRWSMIWFAKLHSSLLNRCLWLSTNRQVCNQRLKRLKDRFETYNHLLSTKVEKVAKVPRMRNLADNRMVSCLDLMRALIRWISTCRKISQMSTFHRKGRQPSPTSLSRIKTLKGSAQDHLLDTKVSRIQEQRQSIAIDHVFTFSTQS